MEALGDDLVLLSILPNGVIGTAAKLRFGLSGAELVRLAELRRIDIERGQITVLDKAPTGDVLLDEALTSMEGALAKAWVARERGDLVHRYLERLVNAGTIRAGPRKALGFVTVTGWAVLDAQRLAVARARLDAIAYGSGGVDSGQAALAGLASVIGLPSLVYKGFAGRAARKRVAAAGRGGDPAAHATTAAADPAGVPGDGLRAAARDAVTAAAGAGPRAAADAAIQASMAAAAQAAASAAVPAAHHAASHGGHTGGGHHH